jgi:iron complex outermembrane recepter protein
MLRRLLMSLVAVLLSLAFGRAQSDCRYSLRGTINDATTRKPIPFATVSVRETGGGATTDENGNFLIINLCRQVYTLDISHIDCQHLTRTVEISGDTEGVFALQHEDKILHDVVVKAKRVELAATQAKSELSGVDLDKKRGETLGEMLKSLSGVTTLNTGATLSKPVVQGLHSDRVLIVNNGVRQEGQQWGQDHAPEIDPFIADKLTVLKGASAIKYGVGAIGGVILVEPRALRDTLGIGGEATIQHFTNGRSGITSGFLEGKNERFSWRIQGTGKKSGDLKTPQYFLKNTGVEELNGSAMLGFDHKNWKTEVFYSHFYSKIGIFKGSHIGNLTDLKNAIERGKPLGEATFSYDIERPAQRVSHDILKLKTVVPTAEIGRLTMLLAGQYDLRQEYDAHRPGGKIPVGFDKAEIAFESPTAQMRLDWEHKSVKNFVGSVGTEGLFQLNNTFSGGLIPDFRQLTMGVYATERWRRFPSPLEIEAGIRYDFRRLWTDSTRFGQSDKTFSFGNISASVGGIYHLKNWGKFTANVGTAWRSPNVNELFSNGVHHGTASFERGDPNLVPERALSATLGFEASTPNYQINLNLYKNQITNFIYLEPDTTPFLTIRGAFPAFSYRQTDAILRGGDVKFQVRLVNDFWLKSSASVLRAENAQSKTWLPLMPADRWEMGVLYNFKNKKIQNGFAEMSFSRVEKQKRIETLTDATGETTIRDYVAAPKGYTLLNAAVGGDFRFFKKKTQIILRGSNLLNVSYRDYLDRLRYFSDAVGRNISVSFKVTF